MIKKSTDNLEVKHPTYWFILGTTLVILAIIILTITDSVMGRAATSDSTVSLISWSLLFIALAGLVVNIVSIFKVKRWRKVVPLLSAIICIGIALYSFISATFWL